MKRSIFSVITVLALLLSIAMLPGCKKEEAVQQTDAGETLAQNATGEASAKPGFENEGVATPDVPIGMPDETSPSGGETAQVPTDSKGDPVTPTDAQGNPQEPTEGKDDPQKPTDGKGNPVTPTDAQGNPQEPTEGKEGVTTADLTIGEPTEPANGKEEPKPTEGSNSQKPTEPSQQPAPTEPAETEPVPGRPTSKPIELPNVPFNADP